MTSFVTGTPERILAARDAWLAATEAWLAAIHNEAHRLKAIALWLEYLALVNPKCAGKIRKILKHGKTGTANSVDEALEVATFRGLTIPRPEELQHEAPHLNRLA